MRAVVSPFIDQAAVATALEQEAAYQRVWLPPEPWWRSVVEEREAIADGVIRKLDRGFTFARSLIVDVRKPGHGVRPVALMAPEVRGVYRALADAAVPADERPDRSAESYAAFVVEPVRAAYDHTRGPRRVGDTKFTHILTSDVTAFYQYVDHSILRDELDLIGADVDLVDGVLALLGDIGGRAFGIPQRSEPSDWLSEVYIRRLERWLIREGFDVWRYNDDFRVGCRNYSEALRAIEVLSRAAREAGLVLNDQKTATPTFISYLMQNVAVEVSGDSSEIDPSDVEAAVSTDYLPDDDQQAVRDAMRVINRLDAPVDEALSDIGEGEWNLLHLNADEHRALRRALNTLTRHEDAGAVPVLLSIAAYQPNLTHLVVRYAEALAKAGAADMAEFLHMAIERLSMNEWQRAWFAYGIRACGISVPEKSAEEVWLRHQIASGPSSLSAAEAAVTLAELQRVSYSSLELSLRTSADDLSAWYLHALSILKLNGQMTQAQASALRADSALANAILK